VKQGQILILPRDDMKLIGARNWIKQHSIQRGDDRHWQLDDNIRTVYRWYKGQRIRCRTGVAFRAVEDFVDRYENIAIAGLNYDTFAVQKRPPYSVNTHVYSCSLILNSIPHRWRLIYNDDTDLCLQVLSDGWCTVQFNVFLVGKVCTMAIKGGNTDQLYQDDGRLKMAKALARVWPKVVEVKRKFHRAQHSIRFNWARFTTPLKLKPGVEPPKGVDEYGMTLRAVQPIRSAAMRRVFEQYHREHGTEIDELLQ